MYLLTLCTEHRFKQLATMFTIAIVQVFLDFELSMDFFPQLLFFQHFGSLISIEHTIVVLFFTCVVSHYIQSLGDYIQSLGFILSTVCPTQTSLEGLVPLPGNTLNLSMAFQTSFGAGAVKMMTFSKGIETATLANFLPELLSMCLSLVKP